MSRLLKLTVALLAVVLLWKLLTGDGEEPEVEYEPIS